jgi:hypothetical protein
MNASAPAFITRLVWLWIVLGILGVAYMALCPHQYHGTYWDFLAGLLIGFGVVACFVRVARA